MGFSVLPKGERNPLPIERGERRGRFPRRKEKETSSNSPISHPRRGPAPANDITTPGHPPGGMPLQRWGRLRTGLHARRGGGLRRPTGMEPPLSTSVGDTGGVKQTHIGTVRVPRNPRPCCHQLQPISRHVGGQGPSSLVPRGGHTPQNGSPPARSRMFHGRTVQTRTCPDGHWKPAPHSGSKSG
jgi:hypothetical protein